jgi:hypothetical protein
MERTSKIYAGKLRASFEEGGEVLAGPCIDFQKQERAHFGIGDRTCEVGQLEMNSESVGPSKGQGESCWR